jgi:hypothetical protein
MAYLAVFFGSAALACGAGWLGWWAMRVLPCPTPPPGAFLAYCRDETYGDFEHGAFLYGLEPEAVRHAQRADVLVIGDSRAQFGFSTAAVRRYFAGRNVAYYLLGMGYGSTSGYARALVQRHAMRPRVLIVNASPFFTDDAPAVPSQVMTASVPTRLAYWRKALFQPLHRSVCARLPSACNPTAGGVHRLIESGEWIWQGVLAPADLAMPIADREITIEQEAEAVRLAAVFVREGGFDPRCTIATDVPGISADARRVVTAVAAAVGGAAVLPIVEGLSSLDGEHLNAASAERWSAGFLDAADAVIAACLRQNAQSGGTTMPSLR